MIDNEKKDMYAFMQSIPLEVRKEITWKSLRVSPGLWSGDRSAFLNPKRCQMVWEDLLTIIDELLKEMS